jgi:predicted secreted protein
MAKFRSKGFIILIGVAPAPTTPIPQLGDCSIDLGSRDDLIDVTTHDSAAGVREFLDNGYKTTMTISASMLWDPANAVQEVVRAAYEAGTTVYVICTIPDTGAATLSGSGRIKTFNVPEPVQGRLEANWSYEGFGATTFTA